MVITLRAPVGFAYSDLKIQLQGTGRCSGVKASAINYGRSGGQEDKSILLITVDGISSVSSSNDTITVTDLGLEADRNVATPGDVVMQVAPDGSSSSSYSVKVGTLENYVIRNISLSIGSTSLKVDGKTIYMDTTPYISPENRTMLPLRFVSEAFGIAAANIKWNSEDSSVTIVNGTNTVVFVVGSDIMSINGSTVQMDTRTVLNEGRTFISVRYLAQALGLDLNWDGATNTVTFAAEEYL